MMRALGGPFGVALLVPSRGTQMTRLLVVVCIRTLRLLIVGALTLTTACSTGDGARASSPTSPTSPTSPPSVNSRSAAVVTAYEAYWTAVLTSSNPPTPGSPLLAQHAVSPELSHARAALTEEARLGQALRGRYEHRTKVVAIRGSAASLTDCLRVEAAVYSVKTKRVVIPAPPQILPIKISMKFDQGVWKVAEILPGTDTCAKTAAKAASAAPAPSKSK